MPHNTQSRSAANVRSQMNLTSPIHRLPNEIIAHIFIVGCPTPNHDRDRFSLDAAPVQHQMLVASICGLWREITHDCPALWTSVVIRCPKSENDVKSYEEMICSSLRRSGTLGLDLAIRVGTVLGQESTHPYCDYVVPHLQRVHTLSLEFRVSRLPFSNMPQLMKLRHLYIWGSSPENPIFPSCTNSSLETFHFNSHTALQFASIPTSRLRDVNISRYRVDEEIAYFINKCNNLQVLALRVHDWAPDVIISSVTLTHLDLLADILLVALLGNLPSLRHLRLHIVFRVGSSSYPSSWLPLPSLRSLSIQMPFGGSHSILPNILHVAPQLVALQIGYDDACEAVKFIRAHRGGGLDDGIRRKRLKRLRLLLLMADYTPRSKIKPPHSIWGDLPIVAPILHNWDPNQLAGWRSVQVNNPIVIDGVEIRQSSYISDPKISISDLADQFTD